MAGATVKFWRSRSHAAHCVILETLARIERKVDRLMEDTQSFKAAVADLQAAQTEQLTAIDAEVKQVADLVAAGGGLSAEDQASFDASVGNIRAATQAMKDSTAKLLADDAPTTA